MNDENDFFDDMIDEEIDDESESVDDFELMDLDDERFLTLRTVLLVKNEMVAVLGLKTSAESGMITRSDPRQEMPSAQAYNDPEAAARWFKRSLATSKKNGWSVIYDGQPLSG
ncbi:MAG TPA: hypothetical protein VGO91_06610 [Pyrinomonadaceae bacterium]|jgi:hypothetical protein|nr:hypothetical protein [Pyrinomonadaceae bacterium]